MLQKPQEEVRMAIFTASLSVALILIVLWDAFETIVLPRRVTRRVRLTRLFYRCTWRPWAALARLIRSGKRRETYLGFYGPLSLLLLLSVWAVGLVVGFGALHWAFNSAINIPEGTASFSTDLYFSGTTFFTLGLGDVIPRAPVARALTVLEAGMGFGFLAIVIGYLPVLYQSFSRREVNISLLDARAGSPPTAAELLRRHSYDPGMETIRQLLHEWERWSAELLESHLSYPVLAYFRYQHNNQSWLAALTTILDTSALIMAGPEGACKRQAELTFAMARHAVVDLAQVFGTAPREQEHERLPADESARLHAALTAAGLRLREGGAADQELGELRRMYEPYVRSLAKYLMVTLPPWILEARRADNWQTSAWDRSAGFAKAARTGAPEEEHF
jgi:hypothetical protein